MIRASKRTSEVIVLHLLTKKGRLSRERAKDLYAQVVKASRNPVFYTAYGIPDTVEGRFEMVCLHGGVLVNRLSRPDMGAEGRMLAQAFFDVMFINLDWSIREAGVGDLAVPRRIKKMMSDFKGRSFAYDEAVKAGGGEVEHALTRNLYADGKPTPDVLAAMARYLQSCVVELSKQGLSDFWQGRVRFPDADSLSQGYTHAPQAA